jgi:hypothetical protein
MRSLPLTLAANLYAEGAHAAVEVAAVYAHQFGGARDVAFGFHQFSLNELAVIGVRGFFERGEAEGGGGRLFASERREVCGSDFNLRVHDADALDSVLQFPHVARPRIAL